MDEYIKREDALDAVLFALVGTGLQSRAISAVKDVNTADVVPKSEVEKLNKEFDELAEEHSDLIVEKDQLFVIAEMQKIEIEALKIANEKMYAAIEATKADVASEILAEIEEKSCVISETNHSTGSTRVVCYQISAEKLAELKKKYTKGDTKS